MLKNKKGFTLIEILAAITILGILMGIAVTAVTGIIQNGKESHYETAEENLNLAGQTYAQQNRSALPKAIGQKTKVPLSVLMQKKYIGEIKDYSDNNCDPNKSYVQIYKYDQDKYSYTAFLDCPDYNSKETISEQTPEIEAYIESPDDNPKLKISIKGNNKLSSYSYIIYRDTKEVKNTGNVTVLGQETFSKTESLAAYTPGKIKIVIVATNIYGNTKTKTISNDLKDTKPPTCIIKEEDKEETATKPWINSGERKITVGCDDGDGSGCTRTTYTKTFRTSTGVGKITIQDEHGNQRDCNVVVRIDKETPKITVKAYKRNSSGNSTGSVLKETTLNAATKSYDSQTLNLATKPPTGWFNKSGYPDGIYLDIVVEDEHTLQTYVEKVNAGGLKTSTTDDAVLTNTIVSESPTTKKLEKNQSITVDGYRTMAVIATDKAGNTSRVNITIPLDRIEPTCSSNNGTTSWTQSNRTITQYCTDGISGCEKASYVTEYNSTTRTSSVTIKDVAGNTKSCSYDVYVDKTDPTAPTSGAIGAVSGSNTTGTIQTAAGGSKDDHSGFSHYLYKVTNSSTTPSKNNVNSTELTFPRNCGTSYYAWAVAVDKVGNISSVASLGNTSDAADHYNNWTSCSAACGGGTRTRTNNCALVTTGLSESCNTAACCDDTEDFDCGDWAWSSCTANCGGGTKYEYRTCKTRSKANPSVTCSDSVTRTRSTGTACNEQECCSSTEDYACGSWAWSGCSSACGAGTKYQYRTCKTRSTYDASVGCSNGVTRTQSAGTACDSGDCCAQTEDFSCGDWAWSSCTATCGGGTKYQYRTCKTRSKLNTSVTCSESVTRKQNEGTSCNAHSCCSITAHNGSLCWSFASNNMGGGSNYNNGKLSVCYDEAGTNCAPGNGDTIDYACGRLSVYGYNYFKYCP